MGKWEKSYHGAGAGFTWRGESNTLKSNYLMGLSVGIQMKGNAEPRKLPEKIQEIRSETSIRRVNKYMKTKKKGGEPIWSCY